jgi:hypothetical protein
LDDGSLAGTFLQNGKKMGLGKNFFLSVYFPRLTFIPNKGLLFFVIIAALLFILANYLLTFLLSG